VLGDFFVEKNMVHYYRVSMLPGFTTLIAIILLGAVGTAIACSLLIFSSSASRTVATEQRSSEARSAVNTCAELALEKIVGNNTFTGAVTETIPHGTCGYVIQNTGGTTRLIAASSTVHGVVRKVSVSVSVIKPVLKINSWQEVAD
jgi:hypothetical protein